MTRQPNILFIMPDQLRADFVGLYGADFVRTPHIDSLGAYGDTFDNAVSPFPICVPCRAALLTGRNAIETGVLDNTKWLRPERTAIGTRNWTTLLGEAGYHTAAIGKMHFTPWDADEGFAERRISDDKRHIAIEDDYFDYLAAHGRRKTHGRELAGYDETKGAVLAAHPAEHLQDRWVANETIAFLDRQSPGRPFAAFIGFPSPHCPYDPTPEALAAVDAARIPPPIPPTADSDGLRAEMIASYLKPWADVDYTDLDADQIRAIRHHYVALIEMLDGEIGRVLDALRSGPFARDTVVIFCSDHGDYVGDYRLMGKTFFHEPSSRVPLVVADWRKPAAPRRIAAPVALPDIYATLLELAGIASPYRESAYRSLFAAPDPARMVFGLAPNGLMARSETFKLCRYTGLPAQAFDLARDPAEQHNVFADPACREVVDAHDRFLTDTLMGSLMRAHADKSVLPAQNADPAAFHARGWRWPAAGAEG
ncbi:MAG: sulfatase-like hydrolase/transferase [Acuticoccus sp.]